MQRTTCIQGEQTVQGHKGRRGDTGVEVWRDWMMQYLVGHGGGAVFPSDWSGQSLEGHELGGQRSPVPLRK